MKLNSFVAVFLFIIFVFLKYLKNSCRVFMTSHRTFRSLSTHTIRQKRCHTLPTLFRTFTTEQIMYMTSQRMHMTSQSTYMTSLTIYHSHHLVLRSSNNRVGQYAVYAPNSNIYKNQRGSFSKAWTASQCDEFISFHLLLISLYW